MIASRGRSCRPGPCGLFDEHPEQPVGEVVEIVQPLAQERVGLALQAGAGVALHLLDGGFRREAVADRLVHAAHPAAVMGEHAIGFEDVAMLALDADIVARQHVVDEQAEARDRRVEARGLLVDVLGEERGDDHARLVQEDVTEADAIAERNRREADRPLHVERGAGLRQALELADGDHLREHHRRRLQRLDLLVVVGAMRLVLDDEHAEGGAGAQDRHAEEGRVDLLAGLRQVAEGRMRLRVRQVQRPRLGGDRADETLADAQRCAVDGGAVQTFGGVQLEDAVRAEHIDRADLGHHVGRDLADGLVEPVLRADRLRHDLAQAAEQDARSGGWPPHVPLPLRLLTAVFAGGRVDRRRFGAASSLSAVEPV